MNSRKFLALLAVGGLMPVAVLAGTLLIGGTGFVEPYEEFVGPFANWTNVVSGRGCVGDGITDDTACHQKAINGLTTSTPVMYLPAGTYSVKDYVTTAMAGSGASSITVASATGIVAGMLVTGASGLSPSTFVGAGYVSGTSIPIVPNTTGSLSGTAVTFSLGMNAQQDVQIICHAPSDTTIKWAGSSGGVMLRLNGVKTSNFQRCTFDGNGVAGTGIDQSWDNVGNYFDTNNDFSDSVFQNFTFTGYNCGRLGFACNESFFNRSKWINNSQATNIANANALNHSFWYNTFTNNAYGLVSASGSYDVYRSVFSGSTATDIYANNPSAFGIRYNYSSGSNRFMDQAGSGSPNTVVVQGNTIVDSTLQNTLRELNGGTMTLLDNVFASKIAFTTGTVVQAGYNYANLLSMGNIFTVTSPIQIDGGGTNHFHQIGDTSVSRASLTPTPPILPATPANYSRTIYEATSLATINSGITSAGTLCNNAVVHIHAGAIAVTSPISVPANCPIQIIGDGGNSILNASSANPVLRLQGPSKVTLRSFVLDGNSRASDCVEIATADQVGARVFLTNPLLHVSATNLFADALSNVLIEAHALDHGFTVNGGGTAASVIVTGAAPVKIFGASSAGNFLTYQVSGPATLDVWDQFNDSGGLGGASISGSGTAGAHLSASGGIINVTSGDAATLTNYAGTATLNPLYISPPSPSTPSTITVSGSASGGNVLVGGVAAATDTVGFFSDTTSPADTNAFINGQYFPASTWTQETETGYSSGFVTTAMAQIRGDAPTVPDSLPNGVTDVRMYGMQINNCHYGIHVKAGP